MPIGVLGAIAIASAGASTAASVYSAHKQGDAAEKATNAGLQANQAQQAYLTHQQQIEQQQFAQTQAANQQMFQQAQQANYGQWAQRQQGLSPFIGAGGSAQSALAGAAGLSSRGPAIPSYQQAFGGGNALSLPTVTAPTGTSNPLDPGYIASNLKQVYAKYGVSPTGPGSGPTDLAYFADKVAQTGGWTGDNAKYWTDRIGQELSKSGASPSTALSGTTPQSALALPKIQGASMLGNLVPTAPLWS